MSQEALGPPETRPRLLKLGGGLPVASSDGKSPLPPSFCEPSGELDSASLEHLDRRPRSTVFLIVTERGIFTEEPIPERMGRA